MVDGLGWVLCVATKGAGTLQEQPATRRGRRVEGGEGGGGMESAFRQRERVGKTNVRRRAFKRGGGVGVGKRRRRDFC
jgi:hypothetical protein